MQSAVEAVNGSRNGTQQLLLALRSGVVIELNESLPVIEGFALHLRGGAPLGATIDAQSRTRLFHVNNGILRLEDVHLRNGHQVGTRSCYDQCTEGGAILLTSSSAAYLAGVTITNSTVLAEAISAGPSRGSPTVAGGALSLQGNSSATLINCLIVNSSAIGSGEGCYGGAFHVYKSVLSLTRTDLVDSVVDDFSSRSLIDPSRIIGGGAIFARESELYLEDCRIDNAVARSTYVTGGGGARGGAF